MSDELAMAVATAVAAKGAEALAAGGRSALGALIRLIRGRFSSGTPEAATLSEAMSHPDDRERLAELAALLSHLMAADQAFRRQVEVGWRDASLVFSADHGAVINQFSGSADKVVQARDIAGDVTL
jgi:hypothetical protein